MKKSKLSWRPWTFTFSYIFTNAELLIQVTWPQWFCWCRPWRRTSVAFGAWPMPLVSWMSPNPADGNFTTPKDSHLRDLVVRSVGTHRRRGVLWQVSACRALWLWSAALLCWQQHFFRANIWCAMRHGSWEKPFRPNLWSSWRFKNQRWWKTRRGGVRFVYPCLMQCWSLFLLMTFSAIAWFGGWLCPRSFMNDISESTGITTLPSCKRLQKCFPLIYQHRQHRPQIAINSTDRAPLFLLIAFSKRANKTVSIRRSRHLFAASANGHNHHSDTLHDTLREPREQQARKICENPPRHLK